MGGRVSAGSNAVFSAFLSAGLALVVILLALGIALVAYQRRFLAMHRAYADGLLRAHEEERAYVAREVHDDALQRIMILLHELDDWAVQAGPAAAVAERVTGFRAELEDLSAMLRRLAHRLHPDFLAQEGLVPMLERLASEVDRAAGLSVAVRHAGELRTALTADQSLVVYRIAQEALSNVVRHAGVATAVLDVASRDHTIELTVHDDGGGFDAATLPRRGLGLISMTERARAAGGTLSVESQPGGGTRVHLILPLGAAG